MTVYAPGTAETDPKKQNRAIQAAAAAADANTTAIATANTNIATNTANIATISGAYVKTIAGNSGAFTLSSGLTNTVNALSTKRPKVISFTFDISLTTNFSVTGVGFAPRAAIFFATVGAATGQFAFGMTDGTTSEEIHGRGTIAADTMAVDTTCFDIVNGSGSSNSVALVSLDSDGFTFSRTKAGSPTGTATVQALCFA